MIRDNVKWLEVTDPLPLSLSLFLCYLNLSVSILPLSKGMYIFIYIYIYINIIRCRLSLSLSLYIKSIMITSSLYSGLEIGVFICALSLRDSARLSLRRQDEVRNLQTIFRCSGRELPPKRRMYFPEQGQGGQVRSRGGRNGLANVGGSGSNDGNIDENDDEDGDVPFFCWEDDSEGDDEGEGGALRYKPGMVMNHRLYGYVGVITGGDATCRQGEWWIQRMGVDQLER